VKQQNEKVVMSQSTLNHAVDYTLYYIHDPMCSWCWGFHPTWDALRDAIAKAYPQIAIQYVLGGLAPDSDEPMPLEMQEMLQFTWRRIQQTIPNIEFNYDFWRVCQPRRSTYPACRGVIAASQQNAASEDPMVLAIQQAYYLHAQNPSDTGTLMVCAERIGLDVDRFEKDLNSVEVNQLLQNNINQYRQLASQTGLSGFPSLVLGKCVPDHKGAHCHYRGIDIDYNSPNASLAAIAQFTAL
jgi:putative protein-disulfide isomerase